MIYRRMPECLRGGVGCFAYSPRPHCANMYKASSWASSSGASYSGSTGVRLEAGRLTDSSSTLKPRVLGTGDEPLRIPKVSRASQYLRPIMVVCMVTQPCIGSPLFHCPFSPPMPLVTDSTNYTFSKSTASGANNLYFHFTF